MATYQVRTDANGQKILSDPLTGLSSTLATSELPGAVQPDGVTTKVDSAGILSALGGNLQFNRRVILKESGTWTVPVTGWYNVTKYNGGQSGGYAKDTGNIINGKSGSISNALLHLTEGMEIPYVIGAGGASPTTTDGTQNSGGVTTFGEFSFDIDWYFEGISIMLMTGSDSPGAALGGAGPAGGPAWGPGVNISQQEANAALNGRKWYGGGGAASRRHGNYFINNQIPYAVGAGAQGSIIICWHDPDYAAGLVEGEE